jgi:hypothetical protein
VERTKLVLLGAFTNPLDGSAGLLAAADGPRRHLARDLLPMAGDYYHLALLYQIEQVAKSILRLERPKLAQSRLPSWLNLA